MNIELTEEQRQAIRNGEAVRVAAPEVGGDVVLIPADQYESIREIIEDLRQQKAFREAGLRCALRWMRESEMSAIFSGK